MKFLIVMSCYTLFIYIFHEVARKHVKGITVFFFLTLLTFPMWINNLDGWFRWGKTLIVLLPLCFVNLTRLSYKYKYKKLESLRKDWVQYIFYLILCLNIIEASFKDLALGNYFNGFAGLLLCVSIPLPNKGWRIGNKEDKYFDLIADLPLVWSILYTTWNIAFVYGENPGYIASSLCILVVPIIRCFVNRRTDLWMSARAYTLGVHIFIRATYDIFTPLIDSSSWANQQLVVIFGVINLLLVVGYTIFWVVSGIKSKPSLA